MKSQVQPARVPTGASTEWIKSIPFSDISHSKEVIPSRSTLVLTTRFLHWWKGAQFNAEQRKEHKHFYKTIHPLFHKTSLNTTLGV